MQIVEQSRDQAGGKEMRGKSKSAPRTPQSAHKAALPQNCLTAVSIFPLLWTFVNTLRLFVSFMNVIAVLF
jgi:hypothetical protein